EKNKELGGKVREILNTLGETDPQEFLKETIAKVEANDNIHVLTEASIKDIDGFVGNFQTTVSHAGQDKEIAHGAVIIATGAKEYVPSEYLYGTDDMVITQSELEKQLEKGDFSAKQVVMIQCVGSRDEERPYCSRVCCGVAIRNALEIKKKNPETEIFMLYRDIRTYGFKEGYFMEAAEKGIIFIRYDDDNMPLVEKADGTLEVKINDPILERQLLLRPDALILSAGILPQDGNEILSQMLKLPITKDGFFLEAHMKLRPVDFANEGVYLCGMAHSPMYIEEAVAQASAAAARASTVLSKKTLESEAVISQVDESLCAGCGLCVQACPFSAIELEDEVAHVNPAICKGCGLCAATCRSGAIQQKGFKDQQMLTMIKGTFFEVI
ncbi:MAG: CoB--CoM heterodisulfide reductase iron-sulfur subunit A family protein, partial [Thermoplasmata archaeon]|nr:CoB--CoM heterodisulfide reductase iron-sulfur subunit A family protein [Thermoplasmata archaeon]